MHINSYNGIENRSPGPEEMNVRKWQRILMGERKRSPAV